MELLTEVTTLFVVEIIMLNTSHVLALKGHCWKNALSCWNSPKFTSVGIQSS